VGSAWHSVAHDVSIAGYIVVVLVVAAIVGFVFIRLRAFRREAAGAAEAPGPPAAGPRHAAPGRARPQQAAPPDANLPKANGRTGADRG
jgi:hypothetical protein